MQSLKSTPMAHEAEEDPAMSQSTTEIRIVPLAPGQDVLTDLLRDGARRLLAQAIEAEVAAWIDDHAHLKDDQGRRQVVRNGQRAERIGAWVAPMRSSQKRPRTAFLSPEGSEASNPRCQRGSSRIRESNRLGPLTLFHWRSGGGKNESASPVARRWRVASAGLTVRSDE